MNTKQAVFLDTDTIIGNPEILTRRHPDYLLAASTETLAELHFKGYGYLEQLVLAAARDARGFVFFGVDFNRSQVLIDQEVPRQLKGTNLLNKILAAINLDRSGVKVIIATDDPVLSHWCTHFLVRTITSSEAIHLFYGPGTGFNEHASHVFSEINKSGRNAFLSAIPWTVLSTVAVVGVLAKLDDLARLDASTLFVFSLLLAVVAYWVRGRFKIFYGLTEIIFGVMTIGHMLNSENLQEGVSATIAIKWVAGLYIIIRGLDNTGKGFDRTTWKRYWRGVFPE